MLQASHPQHGRRRKVIVTNIVSVAVVVPVLKSLDVSLQHCCSCGTTSAKSSQHNIIYLAKVVAAQTSQVLPSVAAVATWALVHAGCRLHPSLACSNDMLWWPASLPTPVCSCSHGEDGNIATPMPNATANSGAHCSALH